MKLLSPETIRKLKLPDIAKDAVDSKLMIRNKKNSTSSSVNIYKLLSSRSVKDFEIKHTFKPQNIQKETNKLYRHK